MQPDLSDETIALARSTHALFGHSFSCAQVVDLRVTRIRGANAAAQLTLGTQRLHVRVTLADGRKLESVARDDAQRAAALEGVVAVLEVERAHAYLDAIARDGSVVVGDVTLSPTGIVHKSKRVAWSDVGGYSHRGSGLSFDDLSHRRVLALDAWKTPWVGALHRAVRCLVPDKDYGDMTEATLPKLGAWRSVWSTSALTHAPHEAGLRVPGTIFGVVALFVGIFFAQRSVSRALEGRGAEERWTRDMATLTESWSQTLTKTEEFQKLPACGQSVRMLSSDVGDVLTTRRHQGGAIELTRGGQRIDRLARYPDKYVVSAQSDDGEMRAVFVRRGDPRNDKPCALKSRDGSVPAILQQLTRE